MSKLPADILSLVLVVATIAVTAGLYADLPDPMPTHWNAAGEVDAYLAKPWGVIVLPLAAVFVFLVMQAIRRLARKDERTADFDRTLNLFQVLLVGFACGVTVLVLLEALGYDTQLDRMIFGGIGLLFIVIGANVGKVGRNRFMGIRTPWTLANDEVWYRSNRLGGKMFVLAGLLLFVNAFVRLNLLWTFAAIVLLLIFPVVYSYFLYRRIERGTGADRKN